MLLSRRYLPTFLLYYNRFFATSSLTTKVVEKALKPNINIGTIGHVDHGKTKFVKYDEIDNAKEEKKRGITINIAHIGYESEKRRYSHTDCPGHKDFIKNMICGTSQMDAAVLVIAATDGVMVQTREHLLLATQIGIKDIIVFINKADVVELDDLELVEIEARELLTEFGYDGNTVQVVKGSALNALQSDNNSCVKELIDAMDRLPLPKRLQDGPFIMPITSALQITGRGTVIVGTVESGTLSKNNVLEIKGFDAELKTVVSDMQVFNESVKQVVAGEHCGILCRKLQYDHVKRGMWAGTPGAIQTSNILKVQIYLLDESEGGRTIGIRSNFTDQVFSSTWDQSGRLGLDQEMLMPGEHTTGYLVFVRNVPVRKNMKFTIREGRLRTLARGVITEVYKPKFVDSFRNLNVIEFTKDVEVLKPG